MEYAEFLAGKQRAFVGAGIEPGRLPGQLYDWQAAIVRWALRKGRAAIWADTGLGKSGMQLAWADSIARHTGRPVLILTPLAVGPQTAREALKFDVEAAVIRDTFESAAPIHILNYEQLHHVDLARYAGVVLDESSILKSYMGATKRELVTRCAVVPYRLCCTATPAPNDYLELGNHAEFLGVMRSNEMIMRWFINNPMEAGAYRLKAHAAADFWAWLASWAVSLTNPADLGYDGSAFELPALRVHCEDVGHVDTPVPDGQLFAVAEHSATDLHESLRASTSVRVQRAAELLAREPDEPWIVWTYTNYDADALRALVPDVVDVRGSESAAAKVAKLDAFASGAARVLVTKPSVAGYGLNWQHCARVLFLGPSYSYEQWYQAIRRTWRYGQTRPVEVYIVSASNDYAVVNAVTEKERAHGALKASMVQASQLELSRDSSAPLVTRPLSEMAGDDWRLIVGDCVDAARTLADGSVGLSVFSPPFANLYIYSDAMQDMGNCGDLDEFLDHYRFLADELLRVTIPGRLCAVHCKDLPLYQGRDGAAGLVDFPGALIRVMSEAGWTYHSRVTIWKDPVIEMQRTKNHGLLYKQLRKDSSASRMGMADFVLAFRKWAGAADLKAFPAPVSHEREDFSLDQWQRWASPVWGDIRQTHVLQYQDAKSDEDERHICPLQLDVIERCVELWSAPGDVVLDPFAGIGSTGYQALGMGRRFVGFELKPSYASVAAKNLAAAVAMRAQGSLFAEVEQPA